MLRIGLTGGIGSGKSTVAEIFKILGIPVFDADAEAKKIMNEDAELKAKIIEEFGKESYKDGELNRKYIASKVFNDPYQLEVLNAFVHPATIAAAERWFNKQNTTYVIKEAALFFEAGTTENIDYIIGVHAPEHLRINRVMKRDNTTRQDVLTRISRQIDEDIKMRLCDFIIVNDEQELLIPQVITLHKKLTLLSKQTHFDIAL